MNNKIFTDKIFHVNYGHVFLYPKESSHLKSKCVETCF